MKYIKRLITAGILGIFIAVLFMSGGVYAAAPTDEILNYIVSVDVNDDASLNIYYHIEWEVLESDSAGPLSWVKIGIPNKHHNRVTALSDTIDKVSFIDGGECYVRVDLDRSYYEGEVVAFDFMVEQDYMYQVDAKSEGYTEYYFTPGWFDDIRVDNIYVRWNADKADSWSPYCNVDKGYLEWMSVLDAGEKFTVTVTYPNDAYAFDLSKSEEAVKEEKDSPIITILAVIFMFIFTVVPAMLPIIIIFAIKNYINNSGFGTGKTKKVTKTRVVYYPNCPGCGAIRKEGEEKCEYCGRSFIKSEEVLTEEEIKNEKEISSLNKDGLYKHSSSPNTYTRVNTVFIPTPRSSSSRSSGHSHSSCAHSSCACACACACAGGGRAGCTNKDFYNTCLKLLWIKKHAERKN